MKVLIFQLLATALYFYQVQGISIISDEKICLPQPTAVVPIKGNIRGATDVDLCDPTSGKISTEFSSFLAREIIKNFNSPSKKCKLFDVVEDSCTIHGRNQQRVSFTYNANLTCGSGCDSNYENDNQAVRQIHSKHDDVRAVIRTKSTVNIQYLGKSTVLHYFHGKKGGISLTCETSVLRMIKKQKYPLCECAETCEEEGDSRSKVTTSPSTALCSLPPMTGLCRASIPRYFYNSTSKQCEEFVYGGCRGNENNFETEKDCQAKCNVVTGKVKECPKGKVYQECGTSCPATCDNKDEFTVCTLECVQGCFCPSGTVELGDKCVSPDQCPTESPATTEQQCPEGKEFQQCGSACPKTCDNKDKVVPCTRQCVQGCFCPSGTVELGDKCVSLDQCPTESPATTEQQCPGGKEFRQCGSACPKTCGKSPLFCSLQCVKGCFCPSGTVELDDKCVSPDQCPTESPPPVREEEQCSGGKEFQQCGTSCPKTCDNKDKILPCTLQCVPGCFCPAGKVESGDKCVAPEECE